jgi:murein L,D-transpeptidase YcbB/YkuD
MKKMILSVLGLSLVLTGCASSTSVKRLDKRMDEMDSRLSRVEKAEGITGDVKMSGTVTVVSEKTESGSVDVNMSKRDIQRALRKAGYYHGAIDGKLGRKSRNAIQEFQREHGLKVDGIAGPQTQKALIRYM